VSERKVMVIVRTVRASGQLEPAAERGIILAGRRE